MSDNSVQNTTAIRTARLFPLGNVTLLPGVVQPLHIFESRYCELIEDALADNQLIAMATLAPGYDSQEYFGRPTLEKPVCIGKIAMHETTEQGTHNFMLAGVSRAIILEELPPLRSYREANVAIIDELNDVPDDEAVVLRSELLEQLSERNNIAPGLEESVTDDAVPLARILDALGMMLPMQRMRKLEFASEGSVRKRLEMISEALR